MAGIYHQSRGGVRGGKDQFNWDDVKTDKDRENYLGHSLMVPVGKWQEGKDLIWYTRGKGDKEKLEAEQKRREEIQKVKDIEARAMAAALGHTSFSLGTTSLTVKELQEVLSRGKTEHNEGQRIQGMGYKKSRQNDKQSKYGTEFEGGEGSSKTGNENAKRNASKSSKKKKKKEKKKKRKEKTEREDSYRDEEIKHRKSYQSETLHGSNRSEKQRREAHRGSNKNQYHDDDCYRNQDYHDRSHRAETRDSADRRARNEDNERKNRPSSNRNNSPFRNKPIRRKNKKREYSSDDSQPGEDSKVQSRRYSNCEEERQIIRKKRRHDSTSDDQRS